MAEPFIVQNARGEPITIAPGALSPAYLGELQAKNASAPVLPQTQIADISNASLAQNGPPSAGPIDVTEKPMAPESVIPSGLPPAPPEPVKPPTALADINAGYALQADSAQRQAETVAKNAEDVYKATHILASKQEELAAKENLRRLDEQKMIEERAKKVEDLQKESLSKSVDPNRYYGNQSTVTKIAAAIMAGIGGYASALTGQPNAAYKMIQDAISNDIDAQKVDIDQGRQRSNAAVNELDRFTRQLGDARAARSALEESQLKAAALKVDALRARATDKNQVEALNATKGKLLVDAAGKRIETLKTLSEIAKVQGETNGVSPDKAEAGNAALMAKNASDKYSKAFAERGSGALGTIGSAYDVLVSKVATPLRLGNREEEDSALRELAIAANDGKPVSSAEFKQFEETYGYTNGEGAEARNDKYRLRLNLLQRLNQKAGAKAIDYAKGNQVKTVVDAAGNPAQVLPNGRIRPSVE